ncbi:MAG: hypothetical protein IPK52_04970 [Chloroflexi bacterium]|nr:hypothetical protein [Chloroflexota bacterium]
MAHTGICGLQLTGTAGITTKVKQVLATIAGATGDSAVISAWAKGKNLAANVQFKATLNTTAGTQNIKFSLPLGTYAFTLVGMGDTLLGDLVGGKLQIIVKPGSGKVFLDDVQLTINSARGSALLPPPEVPQGWRQ